MTYCVKDDTYKNPRLKPYTWYKKHVLVGAKEARLPPVYIKIIEEIKAKEESLQKTRGRGTSDSLLLRLAVREEEWD